ncbi:Taf2 protein [Starmerella bacillaris]|uniref:Transcription initiation factor TFIID subunit 2 n=1 Tax=Starmerella bacillaris TaxID=1247836 RepID=A0AAV5RNL8_STABA|nr:Taf2 protein [Starmerella bacillaris]
MSTSARGFSVAHQRVYVDVDIQTKKFSGWTELTIVPTRLDLTQIVLDARRINLLKCFVNGLEAEFTHFDLLSNPPSRPSSWNVHQYALYREKLKPLMKENGDGPGELIISIPSSVTIKEPDEKTFIASHTTKEKTYEPLTIRIQYEVEEGFNEGLHFVNEGNEPHVYTTHTPIGQATSCWLPCVDGLWSISTWEIEFNFQRLLDVNDDDSEVFVACNNVIPSDVVVSTATNKKTVKFEVYSPVSSQHVGFAIGPFKIITLSSNPEEKSISDRPEFADAPRSINSGDTQWLLITAFALPSKAAQVAHSCRSVPKAMQFFLHNFGSFPYNSYSLVFVADLPTGSSATIDACALTICSDDLLFTPKVIEPLFEDCEVLVRGVAAQWCGVSIVPQQWSDLWVTEGISLFMTNIFIRKLMGNNEYRFRIRKANDRLCEEDINRPPIGSPKFRFPLCHTDLEFIRLKAPLVLYILDRRMTKTDRSLGMARVLTKLFLQSMSGDLRSQLSSAHFIRQCEKVAHHRLTRFFEEWVFGSGYPILRITHRFNKKRMFVEMGIAQVHSRELPEVVLKDDTFLDRAVTYLNLEKQKQSSPDNTDLTTANTTGTPVATNSGGTNSPTTAVTTEFLPKPTFSGPMTIRIHEADGTPYEHVVDLKDQFTKLDIQYNTKYKRLKRTQKFRRNAGSTDDKLINCLGDVLMTDSEVAQWRLVDWGDAEEDEGMFNEAFEWLRVDADFQWLGKFYVAQPDYMYASQLQQDRDVVAQYDAVRYYGRQQPNPIYASILTRTLMDTRYYYGVRIAAAYSLAALAVPQINYAGLRLLLRVFQELYCFNRSALPRANDFSNFANYFVQKEIPKALSKIRYQKTGHCPYEVCVFLLDLIRYNENSENQYSDSYYLASLIESVTNTLRPIDPATGKFQIYGIADPDIWEDPKSKKFVNDVVAEIDKLQRLDRWLPSRHRIVTTTAIRMGSLLVAAGYGEPRMDKLLLATKPTEDTKVRLVSVQLLLDLGGYEKSTVNEYLYDLMINDESLVIRTGIIKAFSHLVGNVAVNGEHDDKLKSNRQQAIARKSVPTALTLLRSSESLGKNVTIGKALWDGLQNSKTGTLTRRSILEICQVLYEPESRLIAVMKAPNLYELSMKRRKEFVMVAKYRSILKKRKPVAPKEEKPEMPKLKLKLNSR